MSPFTRLEDPALNLRVFAVEAALKCGAVTVGDLANVTEAALREKGARDVDVNALRALIVATGGHFAGVRRGRPRSRRPDLTRVEVWMTPEQIGDLDRRRGKVPRATFIAQRFGAGPTPER